ncbi:MAG: hypothetical protein QNK05_24705 [Myxococcota bacterium]|nr:hypothetical protein [Myxococcota bacterium]
MEIAKVLAVIALAYVAFVALMEAVIGTVQPNMESGVRLTTTDAEGRSSERMLALLKLDGKLYISSNHWLRGWYRQALAEPKVLAEVDGIRGAYAAVPIEGEEWDRVADAYRMGFFLRFVCGFAPSRFLRLDPR